jgi:hypothetical protein
LIRCTHCHSFTIKQLVATDIVLAVTALIGEGKLDRIIAIGPGIILETV